VCVCVCVCACVCVCVCVLTSRVGADHPPNPSTGRRFTGAEEPHHEVKGAPLVVVTGKGRVTPERARNRGP